MSKKSTKKAKASKSKAKMDMAAPPPISFNITQHTVHHASPMTLAANFVPVIIKAKLERMDPALPPVSIETLDANDCAKHALRFAKALVDEFEAEHARLRAEEEAGAEGSEASGG